MHYKAITAAIALAITAVACAGDSSGGSDYWVEDGDAVIIRGTEPAAVPGYLELRGILRYDSESRCFFVEVEDSDSTDTTRQTLVWHQDASPQREGDRIGITVEADTSDRVTLWEGDILAGAFESSSDVPEDIDVCAAEGVTAVLSVSGISQDELRQQYEKILQLGDPPG